MIDAHTHLNLQGDDPVSEYLDILQQPTMQGAVLILNGEEESKAFWRNIKKIIPVKHQIHLAFMLDINHLHCFEEDVALAEQYAMPFSIKLHSRITSLTKNEFGLIEQYLHKCNFEDKNIIVDSFLYGSNSDSLCFIELSIYLAKKFPKSTIIMAHFGGIKVLETMLRTRELKNIYYDCSFSINYLHGTSCEMDLRHCILYNERRVMFGSDTPSFSVEESREALCRLLGDQPQCVYENLLSANARRIYFHDESWAQVGAN